MKILSLDFDGTLAPTDYPTILKPRLIHKLIVMYAKRKRRQGWIVSLWTLRGNEPEKTSNHLDEAVAFCKQEYDLVFDYINDNPPEMTKKWGYSRKMASDIIIDDKNFGFFGWLLRRFDK